MSALLPRADAPFRLAQSPGPQRTFPIGLPPRSPKGGLNRSESAVAVYLGKELDPGNRTGGRISCPKRSPSL